MQPTLTPEQPSKRRSYIVIGVIIVVLVAIIVTIGIVATKNIKHGQLDKEVKTELIKQNAVMLASEKKSVFAATVPKGVGQTNTVFIESTVGMSGEDYCLLGISKVDTSIVYHMSKATPKDAPVKGGCSDEATQAPVVPADFAVGSVGAGNVALSWSKALFAASYIVQCASDQTFVKDLKSQTTTDTTATIEGLSDGTQYYCRVAAVNKLGQGEWSEMVTALVAAQSVAPKNLKFATLSNSELNYSWDAVPGATSYVVEYATDDDYVANVVRVTTTATSGTAKNLKSDTMYNFHVKAVTAGFDANHAAFSETQSGKTAK